MKERINSLVERFDELERRMAEPGQTYDPSKLQELAREHAQLLPIVAAWRQLDKLRRDIAEHEQIIESGTDQELIELAEDEIGSMIEREEQLSAQLERLLVPPDPLDKKNIIMEIRAGTGGEEAALFAGDLLRMYTRFAQNMGWKAELRDISTTGLKGIKNAVLYISGQDVYALMKYEGGVHRVQRVPLTEASGRIHTSTVTVAIMHEVDEVEIKIEAKDLKMDTYRSSGAGGQNVNKVETAVRITHLPSGIITACQEERSQGKNRAKAMAMLAAKLAQMNEENQAKANAGARKKQVGTGDRSEKIRTYNFPQNRVTDHRIQVSWHNMPVIMDGGIKELLEEVKLEIGRNGADET